MGSVLHTWMSAGTQETVRCLGPTGYEAALHVCMLLAPTALSRAQNQWIGFCNSVRVPTMQCNCRDKHVYNYDEVRRWTTEKKLKRMGQASASVLDCDRVVIPVRCWRVAESGSDNKTCMPDAEDIDACGA